MNAKLHWSSRLPIVRKVMSVLHETNQAVLQDNPLCKIPVCVPGEGPALFDSRVICEYLVPTLRALDLHLKTRACIQAVPAAQDEDSPTALHPLNFKLD